MHPNLRCIDVRLAMRIIGRRIVMKENSESLLMMNFLLRMLNCNQIVRLGIIHLWIALSICVVIIVEIINSLKKNCYNARNKNSKNLRKVMQCLWLSKKLTIY